MVITERAKLNMKRVQKQEIESTIEMFVNCIYDCDYNGSESGWANASLDEWLNAVYKELSNNKVIHHNGWACSYESHENRFDGEEQIKSSIKPLLIERLTELKSEIIRDNKNIQISAI